MYQKSPAMIDQIRRLHSEGHAIKKIAKALAVSRNTVRSYLRQIATEPTADDEPHVHDGVSGGGAIDWESVIRELGRGRPAKRIYEELELTMSYAHFTRLAKARRPSSGPETAPRLRHEPAEKTQVDYADGLSIIDARTGKTTKTQFFCGVLPMSSYTFGEFTLSQKTSDFIASHERMWAYFGGVTPYVVLDNLKAGVTKAHRYDPDVNPAYCDFGNHSGFAALPARVRTPRDKAAVEAAIGVIQRDFFDRHRATKFYSLAELNGAFRRYLDEFNGRVMADYGASRAERFAVERPLLKPLPARPYELHEWKTAKVHPDCCIELRRSVYSVPYRYAHKTVRVKYSSRMVIVLDESTSETLATHARQAPFHTRSCPNTCRRSRCSYHRLMCDACEDLPRPSVRPLRSMSSGSLKARQIILFALCAVFSASCVISRRQTSRRQPWNTLRARRRHSAAATSRTFVAARQPFGLPASTYISSQLRSVERPISMSVTIKESDLCTNKSKP